MLMAMGQMELLRKVTDILTRGNVPTAEIAARFLVTELLGCSPASLVADPDQPVADSAVQEILGAAQQCAERKPVQYVVGHAYFRSLRLRVGPAVLVPRPETEQLVELVLAYLVDRTAATVLDIGTGNGCIALAIKKECPDARVIGCDISLAALELAASNALTCDLDVDFLEANILDSIDAARLAQIGFDVIVSNPPYIPDDEKSTLQPEVRDHEPANALFCGSDPLKFYKVILDFVLSGAVRPNGLIAMETHAEYAGHVIDLFSKAHDWKVELRKDLAGLSRFVLVHHS